MEIQKLRLFFELRIDKVCKKASLRAKLTLKCFQIRSPSAQSIKTLKAYCIFVYPILVYESAIMDYGTHNPISQM